jgi:hypothetical protein
MAGTFTSFADYVKDLGLQRAEGVLLRYLSEAYKTLVQNVPEERWTDELRDVIAWLRALLALVDSSLVTEWERLVRGGDVADEAPIDISADRRSFYARVRAELHALVRALSREDWDEAAACVRDADDEPWTALAFQRALEPFLQEQGGVRFDHRARLGEHTVITPVGDHQWRVRQVLLPRSEAEIEADEADSGLDPDTWILEGRIDLRGDTNPEGPLIRLATLGPPG